MNDGGSEGVQRNQLPNSAPCDLKAKVQAGWAHLGRVSCLSVRKSFGSVKPRWLESYPQQQGSSGKWKSFPLGRLITAWIGLQIKACRDGKEPHVAQTELFSIARLANGPSHPPPAPGCPRMPHQTPPSPNDAAPSYHFTLLYFISFHFPLSWYGD